MVPTFPIDLRRRRTVRVLLAGALGLLAVAGAGCADSEGDGATPVTVADDRTVTFDAVDFTYEDLDLTGIAAGATIRFEMTNSGTQPHEFEVLDPDGEPIGEVAAVEQGGTGRATVTFEEPGTYRYQCILVDAASESPHTELGMAGTFEVGPA